MRLPQAGLEVQVTVYKVTETVTDTSGTLMLLWKVGKLDTLALNLTLLNIKKYSAVCHTIAFLRRQINHCHSLCSLLTLRSASFASLGL